MDSRIDFTALPSASQWKQIGPYHHHGIALPLFSLRNPQSSGIGEFLDLVPLIHWCKKIDFKVIQLLPLNDSGHDPSPYSAHSAMALHPIYLSLKDLPFIDEFQTELEPLRACNWSKRVKYHQVLAAKEAFLKLYAKRALPEIQSWDSYKAFVTQEWLQGYAEYKVLKEKNDELPWWQWQKDKKATASELEFHKFVQFLCFEQMKEVKRVAIANDIFLKGDIPILINRDSADVWQYQQFFALDHAAGAPPDMFSDEGQYWGFPLYNWEALEQDGFGWWKRRLQLAQELYHIYRLDHIVGFFKIWAIPLGKKANEGFFLPENPELWVPQGEKILRMMLESSSMLPIGEDLGAVPDSVRDCMRRLGICGTKVMRWERNWHSDQSYIPPKDYSPLSMTCLSTHDSETLDIWWQAFPKDAEMLASTLQIEFSEPLEIETRKEVIKAAHTSGSLFHINLLQEYLNVFDELAWANPEEDRINIPGKVLEQNWTYRFLPTIDEIISHEGLQTFMKSLTES